MKLGYFCVLLIISWTLITVTSADCTNLTIQIAKERVDADRSSGELDTNDVTIIEWRVDCLRTSGTLDRYDKATFTAKYNPGGGLADEMAQVDVSCSSNVWTSFSSFSLLNLAQYNNILNTSPRTNCSRCSAIFQNADINHCVDCTSQCEGAMLCTSSSCCNYFSNSICVTQCPSNKISDESYICTCANMFYSGSDCSTCAIQDSDCLNGGIANTSNCSCQCNSTGYTGMTCSEDIDECALSNPCQNNGTCQNNNGSYSCLCRPGYTGNDCTTDINECVPNPCQNNGSCTDGINSYTCQCASGYTGNNCTTDINECISSPCKNGVCVDGIADYTCNCSVGYIGKNCSVHTCDSNPCQNGGSCEGTVNDYSCMCSSYYTGKNCSVDIDECNSGLNPCLNGGSCTNIDGGFTCNCGGSWSGNTCEACVMSGCRNAVCNERTPSCMQCLPGYSLVNSLCVTCNVKDCVECSSKDVCSTCNISFTLQDNSGCVPVIITEPTAKGRTSLDTGAIIGIVVAFGVVLIVIVITILIIIAILTNANRKKPPTYSVKTPKPEDKDIILTKITNI